MVRACGYCLNEKNCSKRNEYMESGKRHAGGTNELAASCPEFIHYSEENHCSECAHYEPCPNFQMYCKALQRRITARKSASNCKYYKSLIKEEKK